MIETSMFGLLSFAFFVGMIHAFDADHVMAVAAISGKKNRFLSILKYSAKWGLGHGGILVLCGMLFLLWGIELGDTLIRVAELSIGIILCVAGGMLLWSLKIKKIDIVEHTHGNVTHTHLVEVEKNVGEARAHKNKNGLFNHDHTPILVGFVHGLAGSAPVIALLPSLLVENKLTAIFYLLLFSIGCLIGMVSFGACLAKAQSYAYKVSVKVIAIFRGCIGSGAILFGLYWLFQA